MKKNTNFLGTIIGVASAFVLTGLILLTSFIVARTRANKVEESQVATTEEVAVTTSLRSNEEVALEVLEGHWGYGQDRIDRLTKAGYNLDELNAIIDKMNSTGKIVEEKPVVEEQLVYEEPIQEEYFYESPNSEYTPYDLMYHGVIYWGGWRFTWYSENVLPGGGLSIPGRWSDGNFVRDENGYICCACEDLPWGTVVDTPWGTACVYDCGCASGTIDIYTSW